MAYREQQLTRSPAVVGLRGSKPILFLGEFTIRRHAATQRLRFPAEKCTEVVCRSAAAPKAISACRNRQSADSTVGPVVQPGPTEEQGKRCMTHGVDASPPSTFPSQSYYLYICIILLLENSYSPALDAQRLAAVTDVWLVLK